MKIMCVGDIHFADAFTHRTDNVRNTFEKKWEQIFELCRKKECQLMLLTGDIFHHKHPLRTSHSLVQFVIQLFKKSPVPIYSTVGNHDIQHNDIKTLQKQPLGVLMQSGVIKPLLCTLMHPKTADGSISVKDAIELFGISYSADLSQIHLPPKKKGFKRIGVFHTFMDWASGTFYGAEKVWSFQELKHLDCDFILNGHDHQHYEIANDNTGIIIRPGALIRYSRNEVDLKRKIYVAVLNTERPEHIYYELKAAPAEQIFDLATQVIQKKEKEEVSDFVQVLENIKHFKQKSLSEEIEGMDLPPDVKTELEGYIESVKK